ncbi:MAG: CotH kinase family protein [Bacteroidales bacterium]|nr:CotH kinase family protein [Bacteroidales bacterium]
MKNIFLLTIIVRLLLLENFLTAQALNPPFFSHHGGFFISQFQLSITSNNLNDTIYYTLDGSEPTRNSNIFTQPLTIKSRVGDTNVLSVIPSNFVQTGNWTFVPPTSEVFKCTVVKARCFSGISAPSVIVTHTYFVDTAIYNMYDMPVISLSTNPENLFSDSIGIYVPGINYVSGNDNTGNYFQTGSLWERPAIFEFFDLNGIKQLSETVNVRIHGGDTRLIPQKALRLYADTFFTFPFFTDKNISSFKTIMLRNSGNDNTSTMFRDAFMSDLVSEMGSGLEYQASLPSVMFINGEFWGIHNLRERIDKYFISSNGNVSSDNIDYLEKHGIVNEGDNLHYFMWYYFLESADMTINSNYDYMSSMIDINNFTDYNIAQIYFANIDWPSNNRDFWRPKVTGGKWRWIVFDTDFGFGLEPYNHYDNNTLDFATTPNGPTTPPSWDTNQPYATMQLRKMLQNPKFRNDFVNRFADMLNTNFNAAYVVEKINQFQQQYSTAMPQHIARWSKPNDMSQWNNNIEHLREFAQYRPSFIRKYIMDYFNEIEITATDISDTASVTLNVNDTTMGYIRISSICPSEFPWSGIYFHDIPIPMNAVPKPGYKFKQWAGTTSSNPNIQLNLNSDTTFTAIFEIDSSYVPRLLFINELMASNSATVSDEFGDFDDWIEIYNPNNDTINIEGFYLSDNYSQPTKHQIPFGNPQTKIPPYGFLLLWADGESVQGPLHLNFKLTGTGELVALYDTSINLIDNISFGNQTQNISYGRYPDGYNYWRDFATPSPGSSNTLTLIQSNYESSQLFAFPNPTTGIINFNREVSSVEIMDLFGKLKLYAENVIKVDISHLNKGVYLLCINKKEILKLILY